MSEKTKTLEQAKEALKAKYTDQIQKWKQEHGAIKIFFVGDAANLKAIFFKQPNRIQLAAAENISTDATGKIDLYLKGDRQLADCYVGGDLSLDQILADVSVYMPTVKFVLFSLVEEKKSSWESC